MTSQDDYLFVQMPSDSSTKVECRDHPDSSKDLTGICKWISENILLLLTLFGVGFGAVIGFGLRSTSPSRNTVILLSYPGELFMRLLKLLILPLIISSLVAGSASLNARLNGKIALRTLVYFFITSVINACLGIALACIIHPGESGMKLGGAGVESQLRSNNVLDSLLDLGRNIIADNIFQATIQQAHTTYVNSTIKVFNETTGTFLTSSVRTPEVSYRPGINTIGIVVFCLSFGTILGTLGERSRAVIEFFNVIFDVVMKMVSAVMWLTPIGVCSVITGKILSVDKISVVMVQLGWFIVTVIIGVYIYQLIIMQLIYLAIVRKNPFKFYRGLIEGLLTAFATASAAAALPINLRLMEDKLRIDSRITRFVLPIGCNINMDGTALFIAISTVFFAQSQNINLGTGDLVTVCFTATAASFSSASVPSAALVLLVMVLSAVDIPTKDVFLLFAIDWLVDRFRTTNNMLGDCYTAAVVEKLSKKELMACDAILGQEFNSSEGNAGPIGEELDQVVIHRLQNGTTK